MSTYIFTRDSSKVKNTTILGPDGSILYETVTPKTGVFKSAAPTVIWRYDKSENRVKVAEIEWSCWSGDSVTLNGQPTIPAKEFLVKPGFWSCVRDMTTPVGTFRWKEAKGGKPELFDASDHSVLHWTRNQHRIFGEKPTAGNNPTFLVHPDIEPVMDHVLIGFLLMHKIIERQRDAAIASAS